MTCYDVGAKAIQRLNASSEPQNVVSAIRQGTLYGCGDQKGQSNPKKIHYVQEATETTTTAEDPSYDLFNLHDTPMSPSRLN